MKHVLILTFAILIGFSCFGQPPRCNSWLYISGNRAGVDIGPIGVQGQALTVECLFNRTTPYDPISNGGELVSNHCSPENVNYLLRPNSACITTTNGFFQVISNDQISLNVTYHTAMVYDGSTLSLYRNGLLVAQTAASGNLLGNFYNTKIGRTACDVSVWPTDFVGYINEVRIWNIVRTQTDIQASMNAILPNPTLQQGLLSYYTFTSLYNKATYGTSLYYDKGVFYGNSGWGSAISHSMSNPNSSFNICDVDRNGPPVLPPISNGTFLNVTSVVSGVSVGDLDITGDKLTIEAVFTRTLDYDPFFSGGEIVSKHCTPSDANYLLRPNEAGIRTSNGFFSVKAKCIDIPGRSIDILTNKLYHIAMVYDGKRLKMYRDGYLVGDVPATGNLYTNNYPTKIGNIGCNRRNAYPTDFFGYIDDVRFWNSARSVYDINNNMFKRLTNPQTEPNLIAYYIFNSLQNQVNPSLFNGTIFGSGAIINQINPEFNNQGGLPCALARVPRTDRMSEDLNSNLSITPNPAIDNIKFTSDCNNCQSMIINSTGIVVKYLNLTKGLNNIYIGNLPKGLYYLKQINSSNTLVKKFIKL